MNFGFVTEGMDGSAVAKTQALQCGSMTRTRRGLETDLTDLEKAAILVAPAGGEL